MVLLLIDDVSDDSVELRPGIRECAIALLPRESASAERLLLINSLVSPLVSPHKV
jgi:hypothetical protein